MVDVAALTRRLAELIVSTGANVQQGQLVTLGISPGKEELARAITGAAYRRGARFVDVYSFDNLVKRERLLHADEDTLEYVPPWLAQRLLHLADEHGARISLTGPQGGAEALAGVDSARLGRDLLPYVKETMGVINRQVTNWCVSPGPSREWAQLVYPDLSPEAAYERLWEAVAHIARLDEPDPAEAWRVRGEQLRAAADALTERRFDAIRLHGPGTDLTVGLLPSSRWLAAGDITVDGVRHWSNLPTEEVFTSPDPLRAEGHVTATRPLLWYGIEADGLRVEFRDGRAVRIDAGKGAEAVRNVAAKDDGASRLGELALVDGEGRIGALGTVFHETLLDENAASHIALGAAYARGVDEGPDRERINKSAIHIDFMIGSPEIDVDGLTSDGSTVPVLRAGVWQI
ncbi:MAG: aminopeptidase [Thermoleophilia bacterium]|nr:aminopeptidase [Thermoleophilia bacterium]